MSTASSLTTSFSAMAASSLTHRSFMVSPIKTPTRLCNHPTDLGVVSIGRRPNSNGATAAYHGTLRVIAQSGRNTPDERESKDLLDAFFVGKALAEAINERIGSAIGELFSEVGRFQAEQQKQVRDFEEEVLERAKAARDKAALEALGKEQEKKSSGLTPSTKSEDTTNVDIAVSSVNEDNTSNHS